MIMPKHVRSSFIIVNYKSAHHARQCIASLSQELSNDDEVIVVNNDHESIRVDGRGLSVRIIQREKNDGFAVAANAGARYARGEILCFLNPDTIVQKFSPKEIAMLFARDKNLGIMGPCLLRADDTPQPWSAGQAPTLWRAIWNTLGWKRRQDIWKSTVPREVAWVSGAALCVPRKLFHTLGGFDENFFLYFEDVDLCMRASAQGGKVLYNPKFLVKHWGGASSSDPAKQKRQYYQSQDYYFKKYFGERSLKMLRLLRFLRHLVEY